MTAVMEEKDAYLASFTEFEKGLGEGAGSPLQRLRQAAIERVAAVGFPTLDDEEWRFTNLAPLTRTPFQLARPQPGAVSAADVERLTYLAEGCRLVFVNGFYAPQLSLVQRLPEGVILGGLAEALTRHRDKV